MRQSLQLGKCVFCRRGDTYVWHVLETLQLHFFYTQKRPKCTKGKGKNPQNNDILLVKCPDVFIILTAKIDLSGIFAYILISDSLLIRLVFSSSTDHTYPPPLFSYLDPKQVAGLLVTRMKRIADIPHLLFLPGQEKANQTWGNKITFTKADCYNC